MMYIEQKVEHLFDSGIDKLNLMLYIYKWTEKDPSSNSVGAPWTGLCTYTNSY